MLGTRSSQRMLCTQFKSRFSPQEFDAATVTHLQLQDDLEDELEALMHQYSTNPPNDPLKQAQTDLNNVYVTLCAFEHYHQFT